jgi:hypothetical protein
MDPRDVVVDLDKGFGFPSVKIGSVRRTQTRRRREQYSFIGVGDQKQISGNGLGVSG